MKYLMMILGALFAANSFGSDAVVAKRFSRVKIEGIASAKIADFLMDDDQRGAIVRVSVDLNVEGNLGLCGFEDFASTLELRQGGSKGEEEGRLKTYLSVITTACPAPAPLTLVSTASAGYSQTRVISTTFDVNLGWLNPSQTIMVPTGYFGETQSKLVVSLKDGQPSLKIDPSF